MARSSRSTAAVTGAVVINEAVTIAAAPGVHASISPASGTAIRVEAGSGDVVRLRNLYLNGQGASYGVYFAAGSALQIENLTVDGFYSSGIFMSVSIAADLYIADTVVRNNGFGIFDSGVYVKSGVAYSHASIVRTRLENNTGYGMFVTDYVRASVKDSVASGNGAVHRGTGASAG